MPFKSEARLMFAAGGSNWPASTTPIRGGSIKQMQQANAAVDRCLAHLSA